MLAATESAKRVRAAIGWSELSAKDVASELGFTLGAIRSYMSTSRPVLLDLERRIAIADVCGVPRWFMEHGFSPAHADIGLSARVETLERAELVDRMLAAEARLAALEAEGIPPSA